MNRRLLGAAAVVGVLALSLPSEAQTGRASWYGGGEKLNRHTANGEVFKPSGLSCAHRTIRLGSKVRVTNLRNGRSVICRVNDRGPAAWTGKIIDLSRGAAKQLGMIRAGIARVRITIITK